MKTGGWKTSAVFKRYDITNNEDQRIAMEALEKARAASRELRPPEQPPQAPQKPN